MFLLHPATFLWDLATLVLLAVSLCGAIGCNVWLKRQQKGEGVLKMLHGYTQRLCVTVIGAMCALGFLTVIYGSFIEPNILLVNRFPIELPVSEPMRIAVVSDIHVGPYKDEQFVERIVEKVNGTFPDLILLPGDFVLTKEDMEMLEPLRNLRAPLGIFAVLGNHDVGQHLTLFSYEHYTVPEASEDIVLYLEELGIRVLRNEHESLPVTDRRISVAGIDDIWSPTADLPTTISDIPENHSVILVSHNPSVILTPESSRADLIVSGHTHGGQIRLPLIGALFHLPTDIDQDIDQGIFRVNQKTLMAVTRGAGESSPRARLLAWPEVMILDVSPSI